MSGSLGQSMADVNYQRSAARKAAQQASQHRPAPKARNVVNLAGGLVSVGLALGAAVWGYKIAVRNVTGIPVIKALEGPMRVAPENPGGAVTAHQGLSVNDVAAVGVATPLPEEIVLAPRPVDLAEDDMPGLAPEPPAALLAPVAQDPADMPLAETSAPDLPPDPLTSVAPVAPSDTTAPADVMALVDSIAAGAAPLSGGTVSERAVSEGALAPEAATVSAPVVPGGLGTSLRPNPRPARLAAGGGSDAAVAQALSAAAREVDAAALPAGTRLVQFGAFDSEDEARAAWDKISGQFGELMAGKGRVIQSATSGGRTFYRLRAEGFAEEADARRFCAAVTAENTECIPVTLR